MTYIPPEDKSAAHPNGPPPAYTPTDSVSRASEAGSDDANPRYVSAAEEKARLAQQDAQQNIISHSTTRDSQGEPPAASSSRPVKRPQSNSIDARSQVHLEGPLDIQGSVSCSSSVTLCHDITVDGKVSSSSSVTLSDDIRVSGKVDSSSGVRLSRGVAIHGKVNASGNIDLRDGVRVLDKVDGSGSIILADGVAIKGKVSCSGMLTIVGDVVVEGDVNTSGTVRIEGVKTCSVGGNFKTSTCIVDGDVIVKQDMKISGTLTVKGRAHIKGDLSVRGPVIIGPNGVVIVDGKRTVSSIQGGLITTS